VVKDVAPTFSSQRGEHYLEINSPGKPKGDEVMKKQLGKVASWTLETEDHHEELLEPKRDLSQVVLFQVGRHVPVRIAYTGLVQAEGTGDELTYPEVLCIVIPCWERFHDALWWKE
jgi:hypothetical protein